MASSARAEEPVCGISAQLTWGGMSYVERVSQVQSFTAAIRSQCSGLPTRHDRNACERAQWRIQREATTAALKDQFVCLPRLAEQIILQEMAK